MNSFFLFFENKKFKWGRYIVERGKNKRKGQDNDVVWFIFDVIKIFTFVVLKWSRYILNYGVVGWISWTWFRSCRDNEGDSIIFTHAFHQTPNAQP